MEDSEKMGNNVQCKSDKRKEEYCTAHSSGIAKEYMNQHLDSNIKFRLQTVSKIEHKPTGRKIQASPSAQDCFHFKP